MKLGGTSSEDGTFLQPDPVLVRIGSQPVDDPCVMLTVMVSCRSGSLSGQTSCFRRWQRSYMKTAAVQIETAQCLRMPPLGRAVDAAELDSSIRPCLLAETRDAEGSAQRCWPDCGVHQTITLAITPRLDCRRHPASKPCGLTMNFAACCCSSRRVFVAALTAPLISLHSALAAGDHHRNFVAS